RAWLTAIGPNPMHPGLDIRGGVHFLLQVEMEGALTGRYEALASEVRTVLRDERSATPGVERLSQSIIARFDSAESRDEAFNILRRQVPDLNLVRASGESFELHGSMTEAAVIQAQTNALRQNVTTLYNR